MDAPCKPLFTRCCIIGLGLMGASVGLALGKYRVVAERWGYDSDPGVMAAARNRGSVEQTAALGPALQGAELVILAAPVGQILKMLQEIAPLVPQGALVTDVGSTKKEIVAAREKFLPAGVTGIGGHPMAGSEQSGAAAADPALLKKAAYILTPTQQTPRPALKRLQQMVRAVGAKPFILEPEAHDRLVALLSHLPYLAAVALVQTLQGSGYEPALLGALMGNGFRDTTRIAKGKPEMWLDIVRTNKTFLEEALKDFQGELNFLQNDIKEESGTEIFKLLAETRLFRRALDTYGKEK